MAGRFALCRISILLAANASRFWGQTDRVKTTLLRVLAGLETCFQGNCRIEAIGKARTYVHQSPYLFQGTVLFNVIYGLRQRGTSGSESLQTSNEVA